MGRAATPLSMAALATAGYLAAPDTTPGPSWAPIYGNRRLSSDDVDRIAEVLEDRRPQFVTGLRQGEGLSAKSAEKDVDESVDRLVWYAGWADKITQVTGAANPVAGPFFNISSPEPTGVVAVVAPQRSSLLGLISVIAPVIVTGNTCVVVAAEQAPLPAITLAEVLATSDLPGGVVNILTGLQAELAPPLAAHMDVNAIDLTGVTDPDLALACEREAAENLKRVVRPSTPDWTCSARGSAR